MGHNLFLMINGILRQEIERQEICRGNLVRYRQRHFNEPLFRSFSRRSKLAWEDGHSSVEFAPGIEEKKPMQQGSVNPSLIYIASDSIDSSIHLFQTCLDLPCRD